MIIYANDVVTLSVSSLFATFNAKGSDFNVSFEAQKSKTQAEALMYRKAFKILIHQNKTRKKEMHPVAGV